MSSDGLVKEWNRTAERVFGYGSDEACGRELAELIIPGPLRDAHRNALARYLATGDSTIIGRQVELVAVRRDGTEFRIELSVVVLEQDADQLFAGFIRPLSARERGARDTARMQMRMTFLAQAGLVLDQSLELDETLRRLADLTVPELAQLTVIDLISQARSIDTAVASALDATHARELEALRREHPLHAGSPHPVMTALREERSLLLPSMSARFQRDIAQGDEHFALMRRLRYHSAIVVPLIARRRLLGVLSLLRMEDSPEYDDDDLLLAEDLARRAALAIDNARLYESTRYLAATLQDSLLPRTLPEIAGAHLAARYRAAMQGQEVGGDFYDAFAIDGASWGLAIGDVRGKGPQAAALTALARYTIRALGDRGAAVVLAALNDAVMRDSETLPERFLTAVYATASRDGDGLALELAAAGHPPPLVLRADGTVEQALAAGVLIGVIRAAQYEAHHLRLGPGDSLVLYTDGLTDARAPAHIVTEAELATILSAGRGLDADALAGYLEASATRGQEPRDDIAVLVIQVRGR